MDDEGGARSDDLDVSPRRKLRSIRCTPIGNRTTARGRSPGFQLVRCPFAFPRSGHLSGMSKGQLAGNSCGGSRGIEPRSLLIPYQREPCACGREYSGWLSLPEAGRQNAGAVPSPGRPGPIAATPGETSRRLDDNESLTRPGSSIERQLPWLRHEADARA